MKVMSAPTEPVVGKHASDASLGFGLVSGLEPSTACGWVSASVSNLSTKVGVS